MSDATPRGILIVRGCLAICAAGVLCLPAGCSQSETTDKSAEKTKPKYEVADQDEASSRPRQSVPGSAKPAGGPKHPAEGGPSQPPALSVNELETIDVPDGTPTELLDFCGEMGEKINALPAEASGQSQEALKTRMTEHLQAIVSASEKVLASDEATVEQRKQAIGNEAGAMSYLSQLQPDVDWTGKVREFAVSLASKDDPAIAIEGKAILFGILVGQFAQGQKQDPEELMSQLRALLQEQARGGGVMGVSLQAMNVLLNQGHDSQAREALNLIVQAFKSDDNAELAAEAEKLQEQAVFMDAELEPKFNAVVADRENAGEVFLAEFKKILDQSPTGSLTLNKSSQYINVLQQTGKYETARQLCQLVQETFADHEDEALRQRSEEVVQMALQRLDLIETPLVIEAPRVNGVPLDFTQYEGKVVLVMFFSATVQGVQQELMNVKNMYQQYHDQGFEVIGVSVDSDAAALKQLLDEIQVPWATVTSKELADQCGANMLPYGVLLDRDGKVTDIFVQGQTLNAKLESRFGAGDTDPSSPNKLPPVELPPAKSAPGKSAPAKSPEAKSAGVKPSGDTSTDSKPAGPN
ncbi:MAG: TlpA disulfide reductase family protein [Pirellulaceae bacterium]